MINTLPCSFRVQSVQAACTLQLPLAVPSATWRARADERAPDATRSAEQRAVLVAQPNTAARAAARAGASCAAT